MEIKVIRIEINEMQNRKKEERSIKLKAGSLKIVTILTDLQLAWP